MRHNVFYTDRDLTWFHVLEHVSFVHGIVQIAASVSICGPVIELTLVSSTPVVSLPVMAFASHFLCRLFTASLKLVVHLIFVVTSYRAVCHSAFPAFMT